MRALLVVNPAATTTTHLTREVIARALGSSVALEVITTEHRGHAAELARKARSEGLDLVVALGGDGTVNEVVNGLLADGLSSDLPLMAVVPGGSTNVFARAVGLPEEPVEATGHILDALHARRTRRIGLGRAGDRWFTFNAGLGIDADVVAAVERRRLAGARSTHGLYVREAVRHLLRGSDRWNPRMRLEREGLEPERDLSMVIVQNTAPWTFFGRRALNPCPRASFETGLDVFAVRGLRSAGTVRHVAQLLAGSEAGPHGRRVLTLHDQPELTVRAEAPVSLQIDGDHLGRRTSMTFTSVPGALGVVA